MDDLMLRNIDDFVILVLSNDGDWTDKEIGEWAKLRGISK